MKALRVANLTILIAALCFIGGAGAIAAESGFLELSVVDASTGLAVPARVRIRDHSGVDRVPAGATVVPIARDKWFPAVGLVSLRVPAGEVSIHVERGLEYEPAKESVTVKAGETLKHKVKLRRWINLRKRGYASGENHIHIPADKLGAMLAAEDLNFGTSLHWWNGPRFEEQSHGRWHNDLKADGHTIPTSVFDAEVEYPWGAVYLVGLKEPVSIAAGAKRSNLPFVKSAHAQGALVCYQAGWSREVLPDALLGYVDVVNLCNNNFQRHRFQLRNRYSNLLNVKGLPMYPETAEGMMRMNYETYYRLLNCGLQIAAGAGSAVGVKSSPCGYNRAYVRAGDDPSLAEFLQAWREGRNFVTNGPMIFMSAKNGQRPGDTIDLPSEGGKATFRVEVRSDQPLRFVEIVVNGKVMARSDLTGSQREHTLTCSFGVDEGAWVAARCTDEDQLLSDEELSRYVQGKGTKMPSEPTRMRFAHTSPIYVTVGGKKPRVEASVEEARKMLAAFKRFARNQADEKYLAEILDPLPSDIP